MTQTYEPENRGTAIKSVYNPSAFMWALLIGIPAALFFVVMFKLTH